MKSSDSSGNVVTKITRYCKDRQAGAIPSERQDIIKINIYFHQKKVRNILYHIYKCDDNIN